MVVRNRGHLRLRKKLRDGDAERHMHRDREDILRDEHIDPVPFDEVVERLL